MTTQIPQVSRLHLAAWLLIASGSGFAAEPPMADVAPVRAVLLSFECEARALPSQREVGEMLGQYNFSQVYASRARLMTEVGRACQRPGAERIDVVLQPATRDARVRIAMLDAPVR